MYKKVIFWDFDGTLVRSNRSFLESLARAAAEQNAVIQEPMLIKHLQEACSWNHPDRAYPLETGENWWKSLLKKTDRFLSTQKIARETRHLICDNFRHYAMSFPYERFEDSLEILKEAREKGYENYVLSNNFPELRQCGKKLGFDPFIREYFLSSEIGWEKPRGEIFSFALEKTGHPDYACMIGDNPEADIRGAAEAGMHTVYVHPGKVCREAEHTCSCLEEIKQYL